MLPAENLAEAKTVGDRQSSHEGFPARQKRQPGQKRNGSGELECS